VVSIRPGSNGTSSFAIQNATGNTFIRGDSTNSFMGVGAAVAAPTSTFFLVGSFSTGLATKTANYTAAATDHTILVDASAGNVTITLPTAASIAGREYCIKRIDTSANTVTIATTSSQTIDNAASDSLATTGRPTWRYKSDGSNWWSV
jgi:hypothetical protein